MIGFLTAADYVRLVIAADHQLIAADITYAFHTRRVRLNVVGGAAAQAHAATGHTLLNDLVGYLEGECAINVGNLVQRFRLRNGARETVEDEAALAVALRDALLEQIDYQIVRHKLAGIHEALSLLAEGGIVLNCLTQDIASGDAGNAHLFNQLGCKRSLAGLLYDKPFLEIGEYIKRSNADNMHPRYMLLQYQPELVDLYHSRGMGVNTWTVNDEENMRDMIERGVDCIISNYPDLLCKVAGEMCD